MGVTCSECTIYICVCLSILGLAGIGGSFFYVGKLVENTDFFESIDSTYSDYPFYVGVGMLSLMSLFFVAGVILMITKNKCVAFCYGFCLVVPFVALLVIGATVVVAKVELPTYLTN
jgi:hypothetical protein